ncbi:TPA: hypothetical protein NIH71_005867 [Pseudomonas aeruginosa]|nr:hypothetical protein [Pseudomonas aeruginosa]
MMRADMEQMFLLSRLYPSWSWWAVTARHVIVAADGIVLRVYWMPALLRMDTLFAERFVLELNAGENTPCRLGITE